MLWCVPVKGQDNTTALGFFSLCYVMLRQSETNIYGQVHTMKVVHSQVIINSCTSIIPLFESRGDLWTWHDTTLAIRFLISGLWAIKNIPKFVCCRNNCSLGNTSAQGCSSCDRSEVKNKSLEKSARKSHSLSSDQTGKEGSWLRQGTNSSSSVHS